MFEGVLLDSSRVIRDPNGHGALKAIAENSCTSEILSTLIKNERKNFFEKLHLLEQKISKNIIVLGQF